MDERQRAVLIATGAQEDRATLRETLLSDPEARFSVIEAESGARALELRRARSPDCLILDDGLPDMSAVEAIERLTAEDGSLSCAVVVLVDARVHPHRRRHRHHLHPVLQRPQYPLVFIDGNPRLLVEDAGAIRNCSDANQGGHHQILVRMDGIRLLVGFDSLLQSFLHAESEVVLETLPETGFGAKVDEPYLFSQPLPGWDGYLEGEAPWKRATRGRVLEETESSALLELEGGGIFVTVGVEVDAARVRLGLYAESRSTRHLRDTGRATLVFADTELSLYVKAEAVALPRAPGHPDLAHHATAVGAAL